MTDKCVICDAECRGILCTNHVVTKKIEASIKIYECNKNSPEIIIEKIIEKYNALYETHSIMIKNIENYKSELQNKFVSKQGSMENSLLIEEKEMIDKYQEKENELMRPYQEILILQEKLLNNFLEKDVNPDKAAYSVGLIMSNIKKDQPEQKSTFSQLNLD